MTKKEVKEVILTYFNDPIIVYDKKRLKALDEHHSGKTIYTGVTIPYIRYYLFDNTVSFKIIAEVLTDMVKNREVDCLYCGDAADLVYEIKGSTDHWWYKIEDRTDHKEAYYEYLSKYNTSLVDIPNFMKEMIIDLIEGKLKNLPKGSTKNKHQQLLQLFTNIHPLNESAE